MFRKPICTYSLDRITLETAVHGAIVTKHVVLAGGAVSLVQTLQAASTWQGLAIGHEAKLPN